MRIELGDGPFGPRMIDLPAGTEELRITAVGVNEEVTRSWVYKPEPDPEWDDEPWWCEEYAE